MIIIIRVYYIFSTQFFLCLYIIPIRCVISLITSLYFVCTFFFTLFGALLRIKLKNSDNKFTYTNICKYKILIYEKKFNKRYLDFINTHE